MGEISRRMFLRGAGAGLALTATQGLRQATWAARGRPTVAIFGGGVAGLTTAHELVERGFAVRLYERRAWGGKARSMGKPGTGKGGRLDLPGEHGLRVFFGFEQNAPDTMRRIPFGSNPRGVYDNLVNAPQDRISRIGKRDLFVPLGGPDLSGYLGSPIEQTLVGLALERDIPPEAAAWFARRMGIYLSSSDARRFGQWENVSWDAFIRAGEFGGDYKSILSELFTHLLQSSRADQTSTKFVGNVIEWFVYNILGRNSDGPLIKCFDRPTSEAWIDPWLALLRWHGVDLVLGRELHSLTTAPDGRITGAVMTGPAGQESVVADYYVLALPVERARALLTPTILEADPRLAGMFELQTAWMSGIQYFLRENRPLTHGHVVFTDDPWKTAAINQAQFWSPDVASTYGDGRVKDVLSVVISEWSDPGPLHGKAARDCTAAEVAEEIWAQMKRHVNDHGRPVLTDDLLVDWHLDPGLIPNAGGGFDFEDPLVLPTVGAWPHRPDTGTAIENLILAGDYVRGHWEVANMEVANESGRRAANAILERSGVREPKAEVYGLYQPPEFELAKRADEARYRRGLPHLLDL